LVTSAIFVFRKRYSDSERPYKAWGYPIVPIVFLLVTLWLLYNTLVTEPSQSVTGLVLIAIGLPVFYFASRRSTTAVDTNDIS
jgi:APA family basic amino acid/polyamine antiporter